MEATHRGPRCKTVVCNAGRNIDQRRWSERFLFNKGDHINKVFQWCVVQSMVQLTDHFERKLCEK